jgi:hypothetical protein
MRRTVRLREQSLLGGDEGASEKYTSIYKRLYTLSNQFVHLTSKNTCTDMRRLTTGIRSEKYVTGRFRRRTNVYLRKPR